MVVGDFINTMKKNFDKGWGFKSMYSREGGGAFDAPLEKIALE